MATVEELITPQIAKRETHKWIAALGELEKEKPEAEKPKKARDLERLIAAHCPEGHRKWVATLVSHITDLKVELASDKEAAKGIPEKQRASIGCVVVPVANSMSHNYNIGEPALVVMIDYSCLKCVRLDGTVGNNMKADFHSDYRPATDAEINAFFKARKK